MPTIESEVLENEKQLDIKTQEYLELLIEEEAGSIDEKSIKKTKQAEEACERVEVFVDKFGTFLKELKVKVELGQAGFDKVKADVLKLNELFGQDKDAKPKELFNLFSEFARQFLDSAEKLKRQQEVEEKKAQAQILKDKKA